MHCDVDGHDTDDIEYWLPSFGNTGDPHLIAAIELAGNTASTSAANSPTPVIDETVLRTAGDYLTRPAEQQLERAPYVNRLKVELARPELWWRGGHRQGPEPEWFRAFV